MNSTARTWKRVVAFLADSLVLNLIWWPLLLYVSEMTFREGVVEIPFRALGGFCLVSLFYKWMFLYFLGATPGKLLMGLRVVPFVKGRPQGDQGLGLLQSFLRVFVDLFSLFFGGSLRVAALFRFDRRHVGDWVAETQVVQMMPHTVIFRRHSVVALILIFQMTMTQFLFAYDNLRRIEFDFKNAQIIVYDFE